MYPTTDPLVSFDVTVSSKLTLLYILTTLMLGCASAPLTEDEQFERDTQRAYDVDNWVYCKEIYDAHAIRYPVHMDHQHGPRDRVRPWMIEADLMYNNCQVIIGKERWIK